MERHSVKYYIYFGISNEFGHPREVVAMNGSGVEALKLLHDISTY
jgi:hypothetical protein